MTQYTDRQAGHILRLFNYLGYDFPDTARLIDYLNGGYLNADQQEAVKYALRQPNAFRSPLQNRRDKQHEETAIRIFGTTNRFDYAGFILPDGIMLDFSEGQDQRTLDHRSVHQVFEDDCLFNTTTEPLIRFMREGNIRLLPKGFDFIVPPTKQQWNRLRRFISTLDEIYIDISNQQGQEIWSRTYRLDERNDIVPDIDAYFGDTFYI